MKKKLLAASEPQIAEEKLKVDEWNRQFYKDIFDKIPYRASKKTIEKLVESSSPHDAIKLLKAGCPPRLLVKILT